MGNLVRLGRALSLLVMERIPQAIGAAASIWKSGPAPYHPTRPPAEGPDSAIPSLLLADCMGNPPERVVASIISAAAELEDLDVPDFLRTVVGEALEVDLAVAGLPSSPPLQSFPFPTALARACYLAFHAEARPQELSVGPFVVLREEADVQVLLAPDRAPVSPKVLRLALITSLRLASLSIGVRWVTAPPDRVWSAADSYRSEFLRVLREGGLGAAYDLAGLIWTAVRAGIAARSDRGILRDQRPPFGFILASAHRDFLLRVVYAVAHDSVSVQAAIAGIEKILPPPPMDMEEGVRTVLEWNQRSAPVEAHTWGVLASLQLMRAFIKRLSRRGVPVGRIIAFPAQCPEAYDFRTCTSYSCLASVQFLPRCDRGSLDISCLLACKDKSVLSRAGVAAFRCRAPNAPRVTARLILDAFQSGKSLAELLDLRATDGYALLCPKAGEYKVRARCFAVLSTPDRMKMVLGEMAAKEALGSTFPEVFSGGDISRVVRAMREMCDGGNAILELDYSKWNNTQSPALCRPTFEWIDQLTGLGLACWSQDFFRDATVGWKSGRLMRYADLRGRGLEGLRQYHWAVVGVGLLRAALGYQRGRMLVNGDNQVIELRDAGGGIRAAMDRLLGRLDTTGLVVKPAECVLTMRNLVFGKVICTQEGVRRCVGKTMVSAMWGPDYASHTAFSDHVRKSEPPGYAVVDGIPRPGGGLVCRSDLIAFALTVCGFPGYPTIPAWARNPERLLMSLIRPAVLGGLVGPMAINATRRGVNDLLVNYVAQARLAYLRNPSLTRIPMALCPDVSFTANVEALVEDPLGLGIGPPKGRVDMERLRSVGGEFLHASLSAVAVTTRWKASSVTRDEVAQLGPVQAKFLRETTLEYQRVRILERVGAGPTMRSLGVSYAPDFEPRGVRDDLIGPCFRQLLGDEGCALRWCTTLREMRWGSDIAAKIPAIGSPICGTEPGADGAVGAYRGGRPPRRVLMRRWWEGDPDVELFVAGDVLGFSRSFIQNAALARRSVAWRRFLSLPGRSVGGELLAFMEAGNQSWSWPEFNRYFLMSSGCSPPSFALGFGRASVWLSNLRVRESRLSPSELAGAVESFCLLGGETISVSIRACACGSPPERQRGAPAALAPGAPRPAPDLFKVDSSGAGAGGTWLELASLATPPPNVRGLRVVLSKAAPGLRSAKITGALGLPLSAPPGTVGSRLCESLQRMYSTDIKTLGVGDPAIQSPKPERLPGLWATFDREYDRSGFAFCALLAATKGASPDGSKSGVLSAVARFSPVTKPLREVRLTVKGGLVYPHTSLTFYVHPGENVLALLELAALETPLTYDGPGSFRALEELSTGLPAEDRIQLALQEASAVARYLLDGGGLITEDPVAMVSPF